jgi:sugar porter (SP) family MFS transporter
MTSAVGQRFARRFPFISGAVQEGNRAVVGISLVAAIGGFLFGYDTGVIGGAILFIKKDFGLTSGQQETVVASILVGAAIGAVLSGYLADAISRRNTKIISGSVYFVAALGAAFSGSYWELVASRFGLGLAVGTASFVAPMYIAEMVPKRMRGGTVSFNQLLVTLGILLAYITTWGLRDVPGNWRWMVGIAAFPGAALAIGMVFMPKTPRWLIDHGRVDEARSVLDRVRPNEDTEQAIQEIQEVSQHERGARVRHLLRPGVRKLVLIGSLLAIFQQIVGVNTVIYYSPTILQFTGLNTSSTLTQALFIGLTNFVFTIVAVLLLDTVGRRFLLIVGTAFLIIALVALGCYFYIPFLQAHAPYMALESMLFFLVGFAVGLGPVFWLMISEIYPLRLRGPGMAVASFWNWAFNFGVSYTFLTLINTIGKAGSFWFYAFLGLCGIVFFWFFIPETKDRSLEQIERDMGLDPRGVEKAGAGR